MGILERGTIKQAKMKEKTVKNISGERENYSKAKQKISSKFINWPTCKILGIILKVDESRNLNKWTKEQEN